MVETFDVSITPYGLTRRTFVYLPDDWQTSGKKYPVLYMFDGHNLFFDSTATYGTCWGLKEYCDAHPNWIIAAPECNHEGNKRLEEYCPYQSDWFGGITGTGHEYMEWLTKEFKPMMDKRYPTLSGRTPAVHWPAGRAVPPILIRIFYLYFPDCIIQKSFSHICIFILYYSNCIIL